MNEGNEAPRLFSVKKLADHIGLSRHTIYKLIERREIPCVRIAGRIYFTLDSIRSWIEQRKVPAGTEP